MRKRCRSKERNRRRWDQAKERASIVIDENQQGVFARTYPISQLPDIEEVIKFLESKKI